MNTNLTIEQNLLKRLYEMKYFEEKSWRDMYERVVDFQKKSHKHHTDREKFTKIASNHEIKGKSEAYKTVLLFNKNINELPREKKYLQKIISRKQTKKKSNHKVNPSPESPFNKTYQNNLNRNQNASLLHSSKILSAFENQKISITGIRPGKSQQDFYSVPPSQQQFSKTTKQFYSPTSKSIRIKQKEYKRKSKEEKKSKKWVDLDVKPWNTFSQEFEF